MTTNKVCAAPRQPVVLFSCRYTSLRNILLPLLISCLLAACASPPAPVERPDAWRLELLERLPADAHTGELELQRAYLDQGLYLHRDGHIVRLPGGPVDSYGSQPPAPVAVSDRQLPERPTDEVLELKPRTPHLIKLPAHAR